MFDHGALWAIATVAGPLLLLAAMAYGVIRVSGRSRASEQRTDQATRDLYRRSAQQERREEIASPPIAPTEGSSRTSSKVDR